RRPSARVAEPSTRSTVTPAKFATRWRRPVSALKSVVLPVFGLPMRATRRVSVDSRGAEVSLAATSGRRAVLRLDGDALCQVGAEGEPRAADVHEQAVPLVDHGDRGAFVDAHRAEAAGI